MVASGARASACVQRWRPPTLHPRRHIRQLWKQMSEATLICAAPRSAKANKPVPSILAVGGKPIAVGEQ